MKISSFIVCALGACAAGGVWSVYQNNKKIEKEFFDLIQEWLEDYYQKILPDISSPRLSRLIQESLMSKKLSPSLGESREWSFSVKASSTGRIVFRLYMIRRNPAGEKGGELITLSSKEMGWDMLPKSVRSEIVGDCSQEHYFLLARYSS